MRVEAYQEEIDNPGCEWCEKVVNGVGTLPLRHVKEDKPEKVDRDAYVGHKGGHVDAAEVIKAAKLRVVQNCNQPEELCLSPDEQVHLPLEIVMLAIVALVIVQAWEGHNGQCDKFVQVEGNLGLYVQCTVPVKVLIQRNWLLIGLLFIFYQI